ncbi:hypothetical protein HOLleu_38664 [Holothuria leucospilota]|uniref:Uncharacterized protein n=1 Tax=Holothuria leucospilota TaxID=206669 RepID=A0A9Q1BDQ9_HOLLE|nr:hypothetical protein HOLleu_38664 [Holothuria leucospilota]
MFRVHACVTGPKLVIPEKEVFPELETRENHFVHVYFGHLTSNDFDDFLEGNSNPYVSVSGLEVAVTIPLAANATGPPLYALSLAMLRKVPDENSVTYSMMVHQTLFQVFLIPTGLLFFTVNATYVSYVTSATWDGVGFCISVKRETIQKRLDAYHNSISDGCGGSKLLKLL